MTRCLIILFLCLTLNLSAQKGEAWKTIVVYSGSIILNAVGDGLNDSGTKDWGHICNAASLGLLLASPFIIDYDKSKWAHYLTSYVALRIAFFDWTYNVSRGLPLNYIGNTSFWDKTMQHISPQDGFAIGRVTALTVGICVPIQQLGKKSYRRNKIYR